MGERLRAIKRLILLDDEEALAVQIDKLTDTDAKPDGTRRSNHAPAIALMRRTSYACNTRERAMATQTAESLPAVHRWTREQYERMVEAGVFGEDDRVELIEGEIIRLSQKGSHHATVVGLTGDALRAAYGKRLTIRTQMPLALGIDAEPEPDLAVVPGTHRDYLDMHPTTAVLVAEVSDTSAELDRTRKKRLYAQHGIGTYWILDLEREHLEVYRDPEGATYQTKRTLHRGDRVEPPRGEASVAVLDLLP